MTSIVLELKWPVLAGIFWLSTVNSSFVRRLSLMFLARRVYSPLESLCACAKRGAWNKRFYVVGYQSGGGIMVGDIEKEGDWAGYQGASAMTTSFAIFARYLLTPNKSGNDLHAFYLAIFCISVTKFFFKNRKSIIDMGSPQFLQCLLMWICQNFDNDLRALTSIMMYHYFLNPINSILPYKKLMLFPQCQWMVILKTVWYEEVAPPIGRHENNLVPVYFSVIIGID